MEQNTETFDIPVVNFPSFEMKMKKLTRRAKKCGAEVGFKVLRRYVHEFNFVDANTGCKTTRKVAKAEVSVFGPVAKFDGWSLVGRMDFKSVPGSVLRMMVPGEKCPPEFHDVTPGRCDHCKTDRRRNDSFLVRRDNGDVKVVGRTCIADFLGNKAPESIARLACCLAEVRVAAEQDEFFGGSSVPMVYDPTQVLAYACYSIRTLGWAASREDNSTKSHVQYLIDPPVLLGRARTYWEEEVAAVTKADWTKAEAALGWAADLDTVGSDYLYNLRTVLTNAVVPRTLGIAVSGITAYDRAMEREVKRKRDLEKSGQSDHVGEIKDRIDFEAEILLVKYFESDYGVTSMVKMVDADSNVYVWWASGSKEFEVGDTYKVRGTVKKHDVYANIKQTTVTRCKLKAVA